MTRTEPCLCGGSITADDANPGPAVLAHMQTSRHRKWRKRTFFKTCPGFASPCAVTIPESRDLCQFCTRTAAFLEQHEARFVAASEIVYPFGSDAHDADTSGTLRNDGSSVTITDRMCDGRITARSSGAAVPRLGRI